MSNTDRAAEIVNRIVDDEDCVDIVMALAAADPPLLVTDEIQAVLDAAVGWAQSGPWGGWSGDAVEIAVAAYLASRGQT